MRESADVEGQVCWLAAGAERAQPPLGRGGGSASAGAWEHRLGRPGIPAFLLHHLPGAQGTPRPSRHLGPVAHSPTRGRAQETARERPAAAGGLGGPGGTGDARGSRVPAALDIQESSDAGAPIARHGPCGELSRSGGSLAGSGVQSASQPEDAGRDTPSRSQRPVRVHPPPGAPTATDGAAGDLGRYQEEGTGGGRSRIPVGNGAPGAVPAGFGYTTFSCRAKAKRSRTGCTT